MPTLRARTQILRATLDQEPRRILSPVGPVRPWQTRRVTLAVPQAPRIRVALDVDPAQVVDRAYTLPTLGAGSYVLELRGDQSLVASAETGRCELTLFVEFLDHTEVD